MLICCHVLTFTYGLGCVCFGLRRSCFVDYCLSADPEYLLWVFAVYLITSFG